MTVIRIKTGRQTGPYERVPQNRFWFVPSCGQGIDARFSSAVMFNRTFLLKQIRFYIHITSIVVFFAFDYHWGKTQNALMGRRSIADLVC